MNTGGNWITFTILFLLMLWLGRDVFGRMWRVLLLWVHIGSGSRLFKYVMLYTPDDDPSVPEEERDVKGIVFSNDEEYMDKIMEVMDK
jgi:hypothetical protein